MPRRNKRKTCEYDCKKCRNTDKSLKRDAYGNKPCKDRHKAHSDNKRKRRARQQIRMMERSAGKVMKRYHLEYRPNPGSCPSNSIDHMKNDNTDTPDSSNNHDHQIDYENHDKHITHITHTNHTNSILGGVAAWLKRILHSTAPRRG